MLSFGSVAKGGDARPGVVTSPCRGDRQDVISKPTLPKSPPFKSYHFPCFKGAGAPPYPLRIYKINPSNNILSVFFCPDPLLFLAFFLSGTFSESRKDAVHPFLQVLPPPTAVVQPRPPAPLWVPSLLPAHSSLGALGKQYPPVQTTVRVYIALK